MLFSSPEYAHGIPGALKNALDWAVGGPEMVGKPIGVLSASAASVFAHPQLVEVLSTMNARIIERATMVIDIPRRGVSATSLAGDASIAPRLRTAVDALTAAAEADAPRG